MDENKSKILIASISALAMVIVGFLAYRGAIVPKQLEINSTQTAEMKLTSLAQISAQGTITFTPTVQVPSLTPLPLNNDSYLDEILFEDDFNDGKADGWSPWGGDWQVVKDEIGNYVYQGEGTDGWAFNSPLVQSDEWENYSVESKFRVVQMADRNENQGSDGSISIRGTYIKESQCYKRYELFIDIVGDRVNISRIGGSGSDCPYEEIAYWSYDLEFDHWHTIKLEALDSNISVFVDRYFLFTESDTSFTNGNIQLLAAANGIVQFDDVIVRKIE